VSLSCGSSSGGSGFLTAEINRYNDLTQAVADREKLIYPRIQENYIIATLFSLTNAFHKSELPYYCWPGATDVSYNSNSFASRLLMLGLPKSPPPGFPGQHQSAYPGWTKPVPSSTFVPH